MLKKRLLVINTVLALGLTTFSIPAVNAEELTSDSQQKYTLIQEERTEIQAELLAVVEELTKIQQEINGLNEQIEKVDQAIADNNKMIEKTEKEIEVAESVIEELEKEMSVLQEGIDRRFGILKERAITLQQSGGSVIYLEVLAGSSSFSDFIDRVFAVMTIAQSDADLLAQQEADQQELKDKQAIALKKIEDLTAMKTEFEGMQAQIKEQKKENDALKEELKEMENESLAFLEELQNKDNELAQKAIAIQQSISPKKEATSSGGTSSIKPNTQIGSVVVQAPSAKVSSSLREAIEDSYKYIGNSVYVFGGGRTAYDIANGRFDCSGYVSYVFRQAGKSIGGSTDSIKYAGRQISTKDMQYGDLVFFDTYKKDGHVGIYIGGGKFIGSQSSTGVAIADMTTGYWKQKFNGRVVRVN
ncbi:coiled-coil domain-containing protein [Litchfieldia alkalitelluris]|uniref:coiled-coil domain-containing protein n=1 Tax=Litchfieldia alkalitelluris TaxID=304268 RepID=UPI0009971E5C|nr:C40 family peptidase [Litchfieldia alkalitelluris]